MAQSWKTWAPLQSAEVREICQHMTDDEREEASRQGGRFGVWIALTFIIPVAAFVFSHPAILGAAAVLVAINLTWLPICIRAQREFLCSTTWAKEQGITPDRLRLYVFSPQRNASR